MTSLALQNQLFSKLNIPDDRILTIEPSLPVQECAEDYANKLSKVHRLKLYTFPARVLRFTNSVGLIFTSPHVSAGVRHAADAGVRYVAAGHGT